MKQNQDSRTKGSSIAWFKLAELIARGEKEKALNLYRLLSHSFDEQAYVLQLEGDILWAFDDRDAAERYRQAAFLYRKEQKVVAAAAVYEHLLTLEPKNYEYLSHAIISYAKLRWIEKIKHHLNFLFGLLEIDEVSEDQVWEVVDGVIAVSGKDVLAELKNILKKKAPDWVKRMESRSKK